MAEHHFHLYIEGVKYKRSVGAEQIDFEFFGLNYKANKTTGSLLLRVEQGDQIYMTLHSPIAWEAVEIFFPNASPFSASFASIKDRAGERVTEKFTFPMMATDERSKVLSDKTGVFNFQVRVPLRDRSDFHNHVIWLDPQIIVSESTGGFGPEAS